ncbi:MAG: DUF47 family protein [Pseudomonadota bacterium]
MGLSDLFMRKQRHVQKMVSQYMDVWISCMRAFREAWDVFFVEGASEEFLYRVNATHKEESRADDTRRKIELELYSKALLPESRGDILRVLETVDSLLSDAESSLYEIELQHLKIPKEIEPNLNKLIDVSCSCCELVNRAVRVLFIGSSKAEDVVPLLNEIDNFESEGDHLERSLIRAIFAMKMDTGEKILLKSLIRQVAKMSDGAQRVADGLTLVSVKRRV